MSLRVAGITDLRVAKQVATLALADNERLYARVDALTPNRRQRRESTKKLRTDECFPELAPGERCREGCRREMLEWSTAAHLLGGRRTLVESEESYPEASEALDLIGEMFLIERALPDLRCITDSTQPHFGNP